LRVGEEWRLPISAVLIRGNGTTVLADRSSLAKEGEAAVE